jgi:hypothetical protein
MKLVMNYLSGGARALLILFVAFVSLTAAGHTQEFRATISGVITDPTGAMVPGATVVVRENQTGTTSQTKSDADGQYVLPFLMPGNYTVTATMPGFEKTVQGNIVLQTQEHPIINLKLSVGQDTQTVMVTTAPPLLDQANASVGSVISTKSVADLPLDGRTPAVLQELSVGVISIAAPQLIHPFDNNAANSWSIGGTPNQFSEVLLDGAPDLTLLGAVAYNPSEDTVSEVSVHPFDTDASFGHTIGGVVNQITKSGTNEFHGTVYEFSQISAIDANTYFDDRNSPPKPLPVTHYNQYGLTVGGPIWIPKVYDGRNKLFFFFAFEGLKDSQPNTYTTTVPTAAERTGDFSQLLAAGCTGGTYTESATNGLATCNSNGKPDPNQIYDPFTATLNGSTITRQPVANNQLFAASGAPASVNPVAAAYLKLIPLPNNTTGVGVDGQDNYITNAPSLDNYNSEFGRLDYNLSTSDHIFFDYRHNNRTQTKNNYFGNGTTGSGLVRANLGATLDNVLTINPSTILDTRFNWTYFDELHNTLAQAYSPTSVGLPASMNAASELLQLPFINFANGGSCGHVTSYQCLGDTGSGYDPTTSYQAFVDIVKIVGRHTLKVGFDGREYRLRVAQFASSSGNFTFNSSFDNGGTGFANQSFGGDLADFLYGLPGGGTFDKQAEGDYLNYYVGAFGQDDWRVTDRLTLNMGLRFDINTPFGERYGRTVNGFNPTATNTASSAASAAYAANQNAIVNVTGLNTLGGLTFPGVDGGAPYQTNSGFLSPRFGFSYSPAALHDKTVFRGGFGIFVQPETISNLNAEGVTSSNPINNQEGFSASTAMITTTNNYLTPDNTLSNPFPNGFTQPLGDSQGASTFLGENISFMAPLEHDPYSERWNIGVQQALTSSTLFEALYEGNHSLHLPIAQQNLNAVKLAYLSNAPYRDQNIAKAYGASVANPFAGLLPNGGGANGKTVSLSNLLVPYPQFGTSAILEQNETVGQSYFNSAILHIEQREKHGLTLTANYSFSKLIEADTYLNDEDLKPTRRISPFDHTHHFTVGATYDLPFGRGKMFSLGGGRLMDELLGGFVVNGVYQFQTGNPVEFSGDIPLQPGVTIRQITNSPRNTSPAGSGNPALSTKLFVTGNSTACPATGTCNGTTFINGQYYDHYRTLPQTLSWVRQDGFNNLDASILKDFKFTSTAYIQLRFETFNTLNHPIFAAPNVGNATASNFGYITSVEQNSLPRQVQLGARIVF